MISMISNWHFSNSGYAADIAVSTWQGMSLTDPYHYTNIYAGEITGSRLPLMRIPRADVTAFDLDITNLQSTRMYMTAVSIYQMYMGNLEWHASPWSDCVTEDFCGGRQTRNVWCQSEATSMYWGETDFTMGRVAPDELCPVDQRPDTSRNCSNQACDAMWIESWNGASGAGEAPDYCGVLNVWTDDIACRWVQRQPPHSISEPIAMSNCAGERPAWRSLSWPVPPCNGADDTELHHIGYKWCLPLRDDGLNVESINCTGRAVGDYCIVNCEEGYRAHDPSIYCRDGLSDTIGTVSTYWQGEVKCMRSLTQDDFEEVQVSSWAVPSFPGESYNATRAFDGDLATAWIPMRTVSRTGSSWSGTRYYRTNEYIHVHFITPVQLWEVGVQWGGMSPCKFTVTWDTVSGSSSKDTQVSAASFFLLSLLVPPSLRLFSLLTGDRMWSKLSPGPILC
jgi:hypothetical protein